MGVLSPKQILYGNPAAADHQPSPADFRLWMEGVETLAAASGGLSYVNDSLAGLEGRAGVTAGQFGMVLNSAAEAGIYELTGGTWTKVAAIPAIFLEGDFADQAAESATATVADRVQTGLDATATAADRVQTALDRIASSGSVTDAQAIVDALSLLGALLTDGSLPMTGALGAFPGTVAVPGMGWAGQAGLGFFHSGNRIRVALDGAEVGQFDHDDDNLNNGRSFVTRRKGDVRYRLKSVPLGLGDTTAINGTLPGWMCEAASTTGRGTVRLSTSGENIAGTGNDRWPSVLGVKEMIETHVGAAPLLHVKEQQAGGVDAGGADATLNWFQRVLNTVMTNTIPGASLSANAVTLPAGTYQVVGSSPFHQTGAGRCRLRDAANTTTYLNGSTTRAAAGSGIQTASLLIGEFTLAASTAVVVEGRVSNTVAVDGLGRGANWNPETFTNITFRKIA
ncbi:MAG: hypothetical protein HRU33_10940 [Rhodobacteraceae bacterium]|nr:hypothetical protein [Paracoccaceae bacterium]